MDAKSLGCIARKGFTLIELLIVFIILGLLSAIAIPIYRANTKKTASTEATSLLGCILTAQKIHYSEHGRYTSDKETLGIEMTGNKYFKDFSLPYADEHGFTARTSGTGLCEGIEVTMEYTNVAGATITFSGM